MSLVQPRRRLGRAFKPHRERLVRDSFAFTESSLAFARSGATGGASPQMRAALSRWRRDAQAALRRMQRLPRRVRGKREAIVALQALDTALARLDQSFSLSDPRAASGAAVSAKQEMARYRELTGKLERRLR